MIEYRWNWLVCEKLTTILAIEERRKQGGSSVRFLPSFLFWHLVLPLFKLEAFNVPSVTVAWRAPGAARKSFLDLPPFKMMVC